MNPINLMGVPLGGEPIQEHLSPESRTALLFCIEQVTHEINILKIARSAIQEPRELLRIAGAINILVMTRGVFQMRLVDPNISIVGALVAMPTQKEE
ncbi:MAG: hypothetical protein Q8O94_03620 [bacterium]|nr:hypothetical protein [bacterium]